MLTGDLTHPYPSPAAPPPGQDHRLLRAVLDGTTDSIFVKDLNGKYMMINPAGARYLGRRPEEIIGRHDEDLFPRSTAEQIVGHDRRVMDGDNTFSYEVVCHQGKVSHLPLDQDAAARRPGTDRRLIESRGILPNTGRRSWPCG